MSFNTFKTKINALIDKAGGGISVDFSEDTDKGRFLASCSDGTTIIGNRICKKVEVRWGGLNHQSITAI